MPDGHQTGSAKTDTRPRKLAEKVRETPTSLASTERLTSIKEWIKPPCADTIAGGNIT
jgi:hypothetical protein